MCGITGFIDHRNNTQIEILNQMTETLTHRGPDSSGRYFEHKDSYTIGLGHRRLSVIDLTEAGSQPMKYKNFTIIYNGELYNFQEVKKRLKNLGHEFYSETDTEVILHAFDEWNEDCVEYFIGMFVFCIYDSAKNCLYFCRDRAGVKPLYYTYQGGKFIFGSELKSLMAHPVFSKEIDLRALGAYFQYGYVPTPLAIFKNTYKVKPGHWLVYDINREEHRTFPYWQIANCYSAPKYEGDQVEARDHMEILLKSAVNYRMVSDVPVGVFLSGGYDSSMVTALLQKDRTDKIKTFTIGFNQGNDESLHARKVAEYLGTDHHELICTENEAKSMVERIPYYYDEPFSDSSAIPTMLVSQFARRHVTVALSADGGDELFAGYDRYSNFINYYKQLSRIPHLGGLTSRLLSGIVSSGVLPNEELNKKAKSLGYSMEQKKINHRALIMFKWMNSAPPSYLNQLLPELEIKNLSGFDIDHSFNSPLDIALSNDYNMYLQNDILTKVDRATMSYSLEGREPLLDHRLFEFAATLPDSYKRNKYGGKILFKDLVHQYLPKEIMDRPKAGFSIPYENWLQSDLNYLIDDYLGSSSLTHGYLNKKFVTKAVENFNNGSLYFSTFIWRLLMFQMWHQKYK